MPLADDLSGSRGRAEITALTEVLQRLRARAADPQQQQLVRARARESFDRDVLFWRSAYKVFLAHQGLPEKERNTPELGQAYATMHRLLPVLAEYSDVFGFPIPTEIETYAVRYYGRGDDARGMRIWSDKKRRPMLWSDGSRHP
jgi:hypothetical protein